MFMSFLIIYKNFKKPVVRPAAVFKQRVVNIWNTFEGKADRRKEKFKKIPKNRFFGL
jgi:hypothetical protein